MMRIWIEVVHMQGHAKPHKEVREMYFICYQTQIE
jgi:hypothetical protein